MVWNKNTQINSNKSMHSEMVPVWQNPSVETAAMLDEDFVTGLRKNTCTQTFNNSLSQHPAIWTIKNILIRLTPNNSSYSYIHINLIHILQKNHIIFLWKCMLSTTKKTHHFTPFQNTVVHQISGLWMQQSAHHEPYSWSRPLEKLKGGLQSFHKAKDNANNWL